MADVVGIIKLRQHIAQYVSEAHAGETFIIVRNNEPVARLVPYKVEPMNEEKATYTTPRQHARQLLTEQFEGDVPRLRRYLLRMIESLDDLTEDSQP